MSDESEQAVSQAIHTISQSDPLIKLLQEVKLGRMKPTDPGLRAITESWLGTYQKVLDTARVSREGLHRLDPSPRVAVLIAAGVLPVDHPAVLSLTNTFARVLSAAC